MGRGGGRGGRAGRMRRNFGERRRESRALFYESLSIRRGISVLGNREDFVRFTATLPSTPGQGALVLSRKGYSIGRLHLRFYIRPETRHH